MGQMIHFRIDYINIFSIPPISCIEVNTIVMTRTFQFRIYEVCPAKPQRKGLLIIKQANGETKKVNM